MSDLSFSPVGQNRSRPLWGRRSTHVSIGILTVLLLVAGLILALPSRGTVTIQSEYVSISVVQRAPFQDYLAVYGQVVPINTSLITASAAGRVKGISAVEGEVVEAGAKLATLDSPDFALDLVSRQAEISSRFSEANTLLIGLNRSKSDRESQIAEAAYSMHKAELELEKRKRLRQEGIVNDAFVKPYADEFEYRRDHLAQLRETQAQEEPVFAAQRRQIEATVAELARNLRELRKGKEALVIKAPAAGRLTGFTLKRGQSIKTGDLLGEIDSGDGFKLKAQLDQRISPRAHPGLQATAQLGSQSWKLVLTNLDQQVSEGNVTAEFRFVDRVPSTLQPGQMLDIKLLLSDSTDALTVPNSAWLRESDGSYIFVVAADGVHADRRKISIGRRNAESVEILAGLQVGEKVLTATGLSQTDARHLILSKKGSM